MGVKTPPSPTLISSNKIIFFSLQSLCSTRKMNQTISRQFPTYLKKNLRELLGSEKGCRDTFEDVLGSLLRDPLSSATTRCHTQKYCLDTCMSQKILLLECSYAVCGIICTNKERTALLQAYPQGGTEWHLFALLGYRPMVPGSVVRESIL